MVGNIHAAASAGDNAVERVNHRGELVDLSGCLQRRGAVARLVLHGHGDRRRPVVRQDKPIRNKRPSAGSDFVDVMIRRSGRGGERRQNQRNVRIGPVRRAEAQRSGGRGRCGVDVVDGDGLHVGLLAGVVHAVGRQGGTIGGNYLVVGRRGGNKLPVEINPLQTAVAVRRVDAYGNRLVRPGRVVFKRAGRRGRFVNHQTGIAEHDGVTAGGAGAIEMNVDFARSRGNGCAGRERFAARLRRI